MRTFPVVVFVMAGCFAFGNANPLPIPELSTDPTLSHAAPVVPQTVATLGAAVANAQAVPSTQAPVTVPACDAAGLKDVKAPKFGVDWPSEDAYDNIRDRCAFEGAFPHPVVDSLIQQCKSKTSKQAKRNIPTIICPVTKSTSKLTLSDAARQVLPDIHVGAYEDEYVKNCPTDKGMWGGGYTPSLECIMMYFGRNFSPGDRIFDFGSGCGHQAAWLKAYFGVETVGVDMSAAGVDWSRANMPGTYCVGDASNVSFVQDNVFDGAYSYAVVYHLPHALQCTLLLEAIRIVKPGGFIYLGWFGSHVEGNPSPDPDGDFWPKCVANSGVNVKSFKVVKEKDVIGPWGLGIMDAEGGVPNYGIQVTV